MRVVGVANTRNNSIPDLTPTSKGHKKMRAIDKVDARNKMIPELPQGIKGRNEKGNVAAATKPPWPRYHNKAKPSSLDPSKGGSDASRRNPPAAGAREGMASMAKVS
jgi:hypothetical protein